MYSTYIISKNLFLFKLQKEAKNTTNMFKNDYVYFNENNILDTRKSIRQTRALLKILPKNLREKRQITDYNENIKTIYKRLGKIKDYSTNKNEKTLQFKMSGKEIRSLEDSISAIIYIIHDQISDKELQKRFYKRIDKLLKEIRNNIYELNTVDKNNLDKKYEMFHELRKKCRELRSLHELFRSNNDLKTRNLSDLIDTLGNIQDYNVKRRNLANVTVPEDSINKANKFIKQFYLKEINELYKFFIIQ